MDWNEKGDLWKIVAIHPRAALRFAQRGMKKRSALVLFLRKTQFLSANEWANRQDHDATRNALRESLS
jgi:hypothetical protein